MLAFNYLSLSARSSKRRPQSKYFPIAVDTKGYLFVMDIGKIFLYMG